MRRLMARISPGGIAAARWGPAPEVGRRVAALKRRAATVIAASLASGSPSTAGNRRGRSARRRSGVNSRAKRRQHASTPAVRPGDLPHALACPGVEILHGFRIQIAGSPATQAGTTTSGSFSPSAAPAGEQRGRRLPIFKRRLSWRVRLTRRRRGGNDSCLQRFVEQAAAARRRCAGRGPPAIPGSAIDRPSCGRTIVAMAAAVRRWSTPAAATTACPGAAPGRAAASGLAPGRALRQRRAMTDRNGRQQHHASGQQAGDRQVAADRQTIHRRNQAAMRLAGEQHGRPSAGWPRPPSSALRRRPSKPAPARRWPPSCGQPGTDDAGGHAGSA